MHKKIISFIIISVTAAFALSFAAFADNNAVRRANEAIDDIVSYELQKNNADDIQAWIDGSLTENAGKSSEWYVMILSKSGGYDFSGYADALERYISENRISSSTTRMKNAMALLSAGRAGTLTDETAESSVGEQGIMSLIYGLHLLNNGCRCSRYTVRSLTDELLSMQFDDGGWAIMGQNGDIDVTAMTVQALAPQYETDENVHRAVDKAITFMSEKQQDDGGYISFGTANPESASQVLIALSSLGTDVTDTRFIKNGSDLIDGILKYKLPDGSFTHSEGGDSNDTATVQAYLSLTAYVLSQQKHERIFDYPAVIRTENKSNETPAITTAAEQTPETTYTSAVADKTKPASNASYKPIAYTIIAVLAVTVCIMLLILKKRRISNFVAVIIIAGSAAAFIFFTDFRSSEEYYSGNVSKENTVGTVTMSIRCDTVAGKLDSPYIPENGIILDTTEFAISEGETVYDILTEAAKKNGLQLQANGGYIAGIAYLYEYDFGDLSGWIYHVNGDTPFVMCSDYTLSDGDVIEWLYTCELGNDL